MSVVAPKKVASRPRVIRELKSVSVPYLISLQAPNLECRLVPEILLSIASFSRELYQAALHLLDHYYGTVVSCRYTIPASLAERPTGTVQYTLDVAVAQTVLRNPVLQVGMIDVDSKKPSFVELDQVDLAHHIEWRDVGGGDDVYMATHDRMLRHQLDTKFVDVETRPQWRVAILRHGHARQLDVFFAWNHPICDGMSGRIFHECLLRNLNTADKDTDAVLQQRVLALGDVAEAFPPSMDKMIKYTNSVSFILASAWEDSKPMCMAPRSKRALARWAPVAMSSPMRTEFGSLAFADTVTAKVVQACRANGTTLTGLFHGIIAASLAATLDRSLAVAFAAKTAVNMRHAVKGAVPGHPDLDAETAMGNNVSVLEHNFDSKVIASIREALQGKHSSRKQQQLAVEPLLWSIAKSARKDIAKTLKLGSHDNVIGLTSFVSDWRQHIRHTERKKSRDTCWVVTNLGAMDGAGGATDAEDPWSIEKANFSLCAQVTGPAISVSPVAIKGKTLSVDITWQAATVKDAVVHQLADDIRDWFGYLAERV